MITGINAAVNGLTCLEQFKVLLTGEDSAIACSNSKSAVVRVPTNRDWHAVAVGYGHTPPKMPGEVFTFAGSDSEGQGFASAADGAIVERVHIFCRPKMSSVIFWQLYFAGNGSLAASTEAATGTATPNPAPAVGCGLSVDATALTGIDGWDLDIVGNLADPVWPSNKAGWPSRAPGNIDAKLSWTQYFDTAADVAVVGAMAVYNAFVTATLSWELKWLQALETPVTYVVRNAQNKPEFVVAECAAHFTGYQTIATVPTEGWIKKPGAVPVTWWPAAA